MKYLVGYQLMKNDDFLESIVKHKDSVSEVYFSWSNIANGRNKTTVRQDYLPWEAQQKQTEDLDYLAKNGIEFNLLLNGNCYGKHSRSRKLFKLFDDTIGYLAGRYNLKSITTTSPLVARFIKDEFKGIEVRASVNMDIGTIQGMDYVSEFFDSFYMQRSFNRNRKQIENLKKWCDNKGKKLYMLANSGCLNNCSAHVFHDNLVAHEDEISEMNNVVDFEGLCWTYLKDKHKWVSLLRDTSYIRPEEIHLYEQWFDAVKLATRVHANPKKVLESYVSEEYSGSILDLCEPNHSGLLRPYLLENRKLPDDFIEKQLECGKECETCSYCSDALERALVDLTKFQ